MSLPTIVDLQKALVIRTKEIDFESLMTSDEVRELEWMGTDFTYPNVRIDCSIDFNTDRKCSFHDVTASFYVYSEKSTSREANRLAGIIANAYHTSNAFLRNGIQFYAVIVQDAERAISIGANQSEWQAKINLTAKIHKE